MTTHAALRPLEDAIASTIRKRQHAEASRDRAQRSPTNVVDRAQARLVRLDAELAHLRSERDRVLAGATAILPAFAELVTVDGLLSWAVMCPYCGGQHRHGGSEETPPAGMRLSHCRAPFSMRDYMLVVPGAGS